MKSTIVTVLLAIVLFSSISMAAVTEDNYKTLSTRQVILELTAGLADMAPLSSHKPDYIAEIAKAFDMIVIGKNKYNYAIVIKGVQLLEDDKYAKYKALLMAVTSYIYISQHAPNPYTTENLKERYLIMADYIYDRYFVGETTEDILVEVDQTLTKQGIK